MPVPKNGTFTPANTTMVVGSSTTVPIEYGKMILQDVMKNSVMMQLARFEPMTAPEKEIDVTVGGLNAYWVGEGAPIGTTKPIHKKLTLKACKLATILPVTREWLTYKQSDFFEVMRPYMAEALYKAFDAATIANINNPFTTSLDQSATASANVQTTLNLAGWDATVAKLNDGGYEPNAVITKVENTSTLKTLNRVDGKIIYERLYDHQGKTLEGLPVLTLNKELTTVKKGTVYLGDFNQAIYGLPFNLNYRISEDATLTTMTGEDGKPVNLFERDMAAMRLVCDVAFAVVEPKAFAMIKPAS